MITYILLIVSVVSAATDSDNCELTLLTCADNFSKTRFDDWNALKTFNDCVDAVECTDGTFGIDKKSFLLKDIASRQQKWGQDWDVFNKATHDRYSLEILVISLLMQGFYHVKTC